VFGRMARELLVWIHRESSRNNPLVMFDRVTEK